MMKEEQNQNNQSSDLSKVQNISISLVNSVSTVILYATGVNLSKESPHGKVIFLATVFLSFTYPHVLKATATHYIKKYNQKQKKKGEMAYGNLNE